MDESEEKVCRACGEICTAGVRFCRHCGAEFLDGDFDKETHLQVSIHPNTSEFLGCLWVMAKVGLICIFLFVGLVVIIDKFTSYVGRYGREKVNPKKICYSNMRILLGAIEIYNMSASEPIRFMAPDTITRLIKEKYLRGPLPEAEPGCRYFIRGDILSDGRIECKLHGQPD